jgi:hypothetical protein
LTRIDGFLQAAVSNRQPCEPGLQRRDQMLPSLFLLRLSESQGEDLFDVFLYESKLP